MCNFLWLSCQTNCKYLQLQSHHFSWGLHSLLSHSVEVIGFQKSHLFFYLFNLLLISGNYWLRLYKNDRVTTSAMLSLYDFSGQHLPRMQATRNFHWPDFRLPEGNGSVRTWVLVKYQYLSTALSIVYL